MAQATITREEFETPEGRSRAWRELMLGDHGVIRLFYSNTHQIVPGKMWRSFQPSPADLRRWKARGVRTIINLRGDKPSGHFFLEEQACKELGLQLVILRLFSRDAPSKETLYAARILFDKINYPAMMHCKSGADRVGLMATLFLFFHEGRPLDEAMRQLSLRYGHVRQGKTGIIDHVLEQYVAHATAKGISLASVDAFFQWVDAAYDPASLKADFMSSWWGDLLTEKILRRE